MLRGGRALAGAVLAAALLAGGAALLAPRCALAAGITLPQGPGVNVIYAKCRTCHDLQYVVDAKGLLPAQWKAVLASMRDYGLTIDDAEQAKALAYLSTYLGPHPPPASTAAAPAPTGAGATAVAAAPDGQALFEENCATCHGAQGQGQPGYYPPLAGNPDVKAHPLLAVNVVLHGLAGPIDVGGQHFDSAMPPFDHLSDAEVAAVVNYVRSNLNDVPGDSAVTAARVAEQRKESMAPAEVRAFRAQLR
jgi:mono/diheme cytochrome c family protein